MEEEMVEELIIPHHRGSFTEISSIREASLMLFQEMEDRKFVFKCSMAIYECSIDIRHPLLEVMGNFAVVLSPSFRKHTQLLLEELPHTMTHMNRPISLVNWNIRGANNDKFKRNLRNLLTTHNPRMVAYSKLRWTTTPHSVMNFNSQTCLKSLQ